MTRTRLILLATSSLFLIACNASTSVAQFAPRESSELREIESPQPTSPIIAVQPTTAPFATGVAKTTVPTTSPFILIKGRIDACKFFTKADAETVIGEPVKTEPVSATDSDFAYCSYHAVNSGILRGAYVLVFQGDAAKAEFLQSIKDLQGGACGTGFSTDKSEAPADVASKLGNKSLKELADIETKLFKEKCGASDYGFQVVAGVGEIAEFKAWRSGALLDVVSGNALFRFVVSKENPDRAKALEAEKRLAQKILALLRASTSSLQTASSDRVPIRFVVATDPTMPKSLFDTLAMPFVEEAQRRRAERGKTDVQFGKRIDQELNKDRVNILLFGYGETHEPPVTEKGIIGSTTIVSYNYKTQRANIISLTHDICAPEIERALNKRGRKTMPVRMDQAYFVGGFPLMREVLEDATGLAIDFEIAFSDTAIREMIDQVFGEIEIESPSKFQVQPFYLDGVKYPQGTFQKGHQSLNGIQVIQFIKTVPVADSAYAKTLEHNARKHIVFRALLGSINQNRSKREFWLKSSAFLAHAISSGAIGFDFDPIALMIHNLGSITSGLGDWMSSEEISSVPIPKITNDLYIVDPAHGDGGVQWVNANARVNPITKHDIETGVYPSLDMAIPLNANPYGDLVTQYWTSVRSLVKRSLIEKGP